MNERKTEQLFRQFLDKHKFSNQWKIEEQKSDVKDLVFPSKTNGPLPGAPDFILTHKSEPAVIVVECKPSPSRLKKTEDDTLDMSGEAVRNYALNGAFFYAASAKENSDFSRVFAAGVVGEVEKDFEIECLDLSGEEVSNADFEQLADYKSFKKKEYEKRLQRLSDFRSYAEDINNFMRDKCKLPDEWKALTVAACLLAVRTPEFNLESFSIPEDFDENGSPKSTLDGIKLLRLVENFLARNDVSESSKKTLLDSFKIILETPELNRFEEEYRGTRLKQLLKILTGRSTYKKRSKIDISQLSNEFLGDFYSEFISYNKANTSSLGIVLTPEHIADLMIQLIDPQSYDVFYDPCTGSGRFVVSWIKAIEEKLQADPNKKDKLKRIKENNVLACEIQQRCWTLAKTNFLLHNIHTQNLFYESCFLKEEELKSHNITKAALNPPYSQNELKEKELDFIEHVLNVCQPGGKVAAIVPPSCFNDKWRNRRKQLLKNHKLEAVITLPSAVFQQEKAGSEAAIGVFVAHTPHGEKSPVWLAEFDDGFQIKRHKGRVPGKDSAERSQKLIRNFKVKASTELSLLKELAPDDIALFSFQSGSIQLVNEQDLKKTFKDLLTVELLRALL